MVDAVRSVRATQWHHLLAGMVGMKRWGPLLVAGSVPVRPAEREALYAFSGMYTSWLGSDSEQERLLKYQETRTSSWTNVL